MKILSPSQGREADAYTIQNEPIASVDLMERASRAFVDKFLALFPKKATVRIFCGVGNNGGDGLAIGRMMKRQGWNLFLYVTGNVEKGSEDFKANLDRTELYVAIKNESDLPIIQPDEIIIDALFGSGLTRPLEGLPRSVVAFLNRQPSQKVSVDIASGLFADQPVEKGPCIVQPDHTISFQAPKLAFMLPSLHPYVGEWHVVDIGLNKKIIEQIETSYFFTEAHDLISLVPTRSRYDHKGKVGRLQLIAGSKGKMGAAVLCSKAALRTGVGLLTVRVPVCGTTVLQTAVPEAMVDEDAGKNEISKMPQLESTLGIGPGIGTTLATVEAFSHLIKGLNKPVVVDADAINILAQNPQLISHLPAESILTPHPGEFERLVGAWGNDYEKLDMLTGFCKKYQLNMVLKGAFSAICSSMGTICFNSTGNPGMATAGSGDVLTGIVSSLLAQKLDPFDALILGVYIHGLAGDLAINEMNPNSMTAPDIIDHISAALDHLQKK